MRLARSLALLGALLGALLPGPALAQAPGGMSPIQRCEQNHQSCVRACFGADAQGCMASCSATRAHCIQNPSTATQPRR